MWHLYSQQSEGVETMLTGPLLISTFRRGKVYPHKLKLNSLNLRLATELIQLVNSSIGDRRSEIDEQVKGLTFEKINPKVIQGMQKILFDRSTFTHSAEKNPEEIRDDVFTASAEYWKSAKATPDITRHKEHILFNLNIDSSSHATDTESWLFSDVTGNQSLISVNILTPEDLIHRFNINQVQGLLLNAQDLEVKIHRKKNSTFGQVMHMLKFFRLMFEIREADSEWITIAIDGPSAVLENRRSYGLELAQFFPAIILLSGSWQLKATVKRSHRGRKNQLEISDRDEYQTFYQENRVWHHHKIDSLIDRFNEKYGDLLIAKHEQELIGLKDNHYLLPDFSITRQKSEKGYEFEEKGIKVEWIPYLSNAKISRLMRINRELPANYLFAVKGKRAKLKSLSHQMGAHLMIYSNELTVPALKKQYDMLKD